MKCVLITGSSGGMGLAIAKRFLSAGYKVYGLDIKEPSETIDNLIHVSTNLTETESILHAFEAIKHESLSAIINTAGMYDLNSLIEMSEDEFIKIFNVNLFSIYRVNKTFLPILEKGGRIIMISSELAPLDPLPFTGIYAISKTAIEKYAYSLRMELQLLDYKVIIIRPGAVDTTLLDVSTSRLDDFVNNTKLYTCNAQKFKNIVDSVESKKVPPEKIANLVYKAYSAKKPKYIYKINRNKLLLLLNILPKRLQNRIIKKILTKRTK